MAIDNRLKVYDEQGNLVDYDILASDVKFLPDGKDLPTKLAEMQDAIEDAGSGDGTVTGVKVNGTTHEPNDQGVVDIGTVITQHQDISGLATKTELAGKVDKNGTDSLMTAAEHTKLAGIAAGAQVNTINSISVNGTQQTPVNGNVDISVGGGSVESVTVSGTKYTPDINGDVDLGNLRGQDGNSGVASADGVESVNNLNGGTTDTQSKVYVLGANQGKRLRDQIELVYQRMQTLYGLLGNIAFWEGKPAANTVLPELDWGAPKHAVTITNSLSNSVITRNGEPVSSSFQAEEGSTVTLIVAPADGYALTSVSYVKDGGSSTSATSLGDGTYKIEFVMGGSDVTITVSGTALAAYSVTLNLTNCSKVSGPTSVVSGGEATFVFAASQGYALPSANPTVSGATITSWEKATGTLVIGSVTGNVEISIAAVEALPYEVPTGGELLYWWDGLTVQAGDTAWVDKINGLSVPKSSNNDSTTTPDATNHCWKFENSYNSSGRGLSIDSQSLDNIDPDECTIEVVYKPTLWPSNDFKRANVCIFTRRNSNSDDALGIYFVTKEEGASGYITGCNAGNVKDGTWALNNVANQMYCVGMNNDYAVSNGTALALMTGTNATGYTNNTGSTNGTGAICIGCYSNGSNKYAVMHGNIYAIRIYSGHLTEAQMLANQKVDNQRYGLGLTLPETVQSNS